MRIAMVVNPVSGGWDPRDPGTWGGGEEAFARLAEAFAKAGHEVVCHWQGEAMDAFGCQWLPYPADGHVEAAPYDVAVWRKTPEEARRWKLAAKDVLWFDQTRPFDPGPFASVVVASEFLRRILAGMTPACEGRLIVVPEGHVPSEIMRRAGERPPLVLHSSSPDRGLETLLRLWPRVREARPDARLLCTYDWRRFLACGGDRAFLRRLELAAEVAGGAEFATLSPLDMAEAYGRAAVWAYWCTGGEHYCHSAVKAQLGGALPVVKPWGALHETVRCGFKVETEDDFVESLVLALDPETQRAARDADGRLVPAPGRTLPDQTWDDVAARWFAEVFPREAPRGGSRILALPSAPPFTMPPGWNAPQASWPAMAHWLESFGAKRPWLSPTLGVRIQFHQGEPPTGPADGDAALFGYDVEDGGTATGFLDAVPDGTRVGLVVSHGPWRADKRRRHLDRRDVAAIFGRQPDLTMRTLPLDGDGNAATFVGFRLVKGTLGRRDVRRALRVAAPRETCSACVITLNAADTLGTAMRSLAGVVDEFCVVDTGSTDGTVETAERVGRDLGIPTTVRPGYNPRWCFDCVSTHDVGEMVPGHRLAGFETPRNQSLALAKGDWVLWLDADEKLVGAKALAKYLRHNEFRGYAVPQHHFSVDPPAAMKVDMPVRLFRRKDDGSERGLFPYGPLSWPTYGTGCDVRFAGVVHEHPGQAPDHGAGVGPVVVLGDVWISHTGYLTEEIRRGRFRRNWPLMAADRMKYPDRRLGRFLWLRDLTHHVRYLLETNGGQRTGEVVALAEEGFAEWTDHFLAATDPFSQEAAQYAASLAQILGRGYDVELTAKVRKPEVGGEQVEIALAGRYGDAAQILKALGARLGEMERFEGPR